MPIVIPDWLLASKHVSNVSLVGQTGVVSVSGMTLTDDVSVVLSGQLAALNVQLTPDTAEINTILGGRHNNVVVADSFTLQMDITKVNGGTNVDALRRMIAGYWVAGVKTPGYDNFKASWVEGNLASHIDTMTLYGSRGPYNCDIRGRGDIIASLAINCLDVGADDFFKVVRT